MSSGGSRQGLLILRRGDSTVKHSLSTAARITTLTNAYWTVGGQAEGPPRQSPSVSPAMRRGSGNASIRIAQVKTSPGEPCLWSFRHATYRDQNAVHSHVLRPVFGSITWHRYPRYTKETVPRSNSSLLGRILCDPAKPRGPGRISLTTHPPDTSRMRR